MFASIVLGLLLFDGIITFYFVIKNKGILISISALAGVLILFVLAYASSKL